MANVALIADIKESRNMRVPERIDVQQKLSEIVGFANDVYGKGMRYKLDFSSGDSVQGLFMHPSSAFYCCEIIRSAIFPYDIRCGIGAGDLIDMPYESSNMMDGSSYHNARSMLTYSKDNGFEMLFKSDSAGDGLVNQYLAAAQAFMSKQSRKQRMIGHLVSLLNPLATADMDLKAYDAGICRFIGPYPGIYGSLGKEAAGDPAASSFGSGHNKTVPYLQPSYPFGHDAAAFNRKTINRNTQTMIGKMLGVSSENIRQMIIKGDMEMIRSLFISASLAAQHFLGDEL